MQQVSSSRDFAFVSLGKLQLSRSGKVTEIASTFGDRIRERLLEIEKRHAWKSQGAGARFMGMWAPRIDTDAANMNIFITSLARGARRGEVIYTLETTDICALLALDEAEQEEQRLWHSDKTRIRDLTRHSTEDRIACAVWDANGTANIGVMNASGSRLRELTEGDSLDISPRWSPASADILVYQSAGVGRNRDGHPVTYGAFEVHQLDLSNGDLQTLLSHPKFDFLAPQLDSEGRLYCIRRPRRDPFHRPWWKAIVDFVLIPWRFLVAIYAFFNFFTMRYTGRPLAQGGNAAKGADLKRMMLWGNMVDAEQQMRAKPHEENPDLVPRDWELIRQDPNGEVVTLARGVLSFDLFADNSLIYSNGSAVFQLTPDGANTRLLKHSFIEKVIAW